MDPSHAWAVRFDDAEWQVVRALEDARLVVVSGEPDHEADRRRCPLDDLLRLGPPLVRALEAEAGGSAIRASTGT